MSVQESLPAAPATAEAPLLVPHATVAALHDVSKSMSGVPILRGVSLSLAAHEVLLIRGPSGSGKSTAMRILSGIERPDEGEVTLLGQRLDALPPRRRQALIRGVGLGFQDPLLDNALSVLENLTALARINGRFSEHRSADLKRLAELAEVLGIAAKLARQTATLSGGEKLRLAIGRALVCRPAVLLLDEPTHMVDSLGKEHIYRALSCVVQREQLSVILVSHDDQARGFGSRELVFDAGRLL